MDIKNIIKQSIKDNDDLQIDNILKEVNSELKEQIIECNVSSLKEFINITKHLKGITWLRPNLVNENFIKKFEKLFIEDTSFSIDRKIDLYFKYLSESSVLNNYFYNSKKIEELILKSLSNKKDRFYKNILVNNNLYSENITFYIFIISKLIQNGDERIFKIYNDIWLNLDNDIFEFLLESILLNNVEKVYKNISKFLYIDNKEKKDIISKLFMTNIIFRYNLEYHIKNDNKNSIEYICNLFNNLNIEEKIKVCGNILVIDNVEKFLQYDISNEFKNLFIKYFIYRDQNSKVISRVFENRKIDNIELFKYPYQLGLDLYLINKYNIVLNNEELHKFKNIVSNDKIIKKQYNLSDKEFFNILKTIKKYEYSYIKNSLYNSRINLLMNELIISVNIYGKNFFKDYISNLSHQKDIKNIDKNL